MGAGGLCQGHIWDDEEDTFDLCFQRQVLSSLPLLLLLLLMPVSYLYRLRSTPARHGVKYSPLDLARHACALALAVVPLSILAYNHAQLRPVPAVVWYQVSVTSAAALLSMVLLHAEASRGVSEAPLLRIFWVLVLAVNLVELPSTASDSYERGSLTLSDWRIYVQVVIVAVGTALVVLWNAKRTGRRGAAGFSKEMQDPLLGALEEDELLDESSKHARKPLPEVEAGLFSVWSFSWLNPILQTGYTRPLVHEDLFELHPKETADIICARLERAWLREKARRKKPSLGRALTHAFGWTFAVSAVYKFIYDTLLFVGPLLLNKLINYLNSDLPTYKGLEYLALLFLSAVASSITLHQYFHRAFRTGMRLKSAVIGIVYKKALKIRPGQTKADEPTGKAKKGQPPAAKAAAKSTGEITNLMAVDAQRLQDLMSYFSTLWSAPYQCSVALYFLSRQLGVAIVAGVAVMLLSIPISAAVARRTRTIQRALMKVKDERIKLTNEIFSGVKIIKLYAWEKSFEAKVKRVRDKEMALLKKYMLTNIGARFTWTVVPVAVSLASFSLYVLLGNKLTAATAFTSIALFNILRFPLAMFPQMISSCAEAVLSLERIRRFLETPEVEPLPPLGPARLQGPPVSLKDVDLEWDADAPLLKNVTLDAYPRSLTVVIGATGSGKSGLLLSLIGDLSPTRGDLRVSGSIAYVAQTAWIQNATVRDNILFGKPFDPALYNMVLEVCALLPDLAILPAGDQTEIGEKGINLSGGQKQRVALARAVYQECDVYLLDDCLSAVDSQVARHIFERCILGVLNSRTVILVTHNLHFLDQADQILLLDGQSVAFKGTYRDFTKTGHAFVGLSRAAGVGDHDEEEPVQADGEGEEGKAKDGQEQRGAAGTDAAAVGKKSKDEGAAAGSKKKKTPGGTLVEKEGVAVGSVGLKVYKAYVAGAGGILLFIGAACCLLGGQGLQIGSNAWLSYWSDNNLSASEGLDTYSIFCCASAVSILITLLVFSLAGVRAARVFHEQILSALLRAPMAFFDTTPTGRIINRFSKDTYTIDETLMPSIYMYLQCAVQVLGTVVVISLANPFFLLAVLPPFGLYYLAQCYYVPTSRELKRLDSVSRSPIFSHFGETLEGVSTIRAFRVQPHFVQDNEHRVDYNLQAYYVYIASNRWLAMRLEFVGACIVTLAGLFAIIGKDVSPGRGGLAISYALSITQTLNWLVRMTSEVETNIVAVERIKEYSEVESEAPAIIADKRPADSWPSQGAIVIKDLCLAYRPGLPLVLKNLSLQIRAGEKVGIVGRTGAGKSSLLLALLRLVEPRSGSIEVDGVDTLKIGLDDLRSHFSIIPQDPVLFTGSVRFNVDPFDRYTDEEVWRALDRAHLGTHIRSLPNTINATVEEGGKNFSLGERQLLCMARALLRHSKVLLLDEATSAVDAETDKWIQDTIRTEFADSTILTIAHRLVTLTEYDRIVVLDSGVVIEEGGPVELLRKTDGAFRGMCEQAGNIDKLIHTFEEAALLKAQRKSSS